MCSPFSCYGPGETTSWQSTEQHHLPPLLEAEVPKSLSVPEDTCHHPVPPISALTVPQPTTPRFHRNNNYLLPSAGGGGGAGGYVSCCPAEPSDDNRITGNFEQAAIPGEFDGSQEAGDTLGDEGFRGEDGVWYKRPDVDDGTLEELNDVHGIKHSERLSKLLADYQDGINFSLGEGGRELLRACLNTKGCKGRQLQGASVPLLLQLAKDWGLWNIAMRIKVERCTGELSPKHEAFVRFKAMQTQIRKYLKKEQMHTERDDAGRITEIHFEEFKCLTLGKEGRENLRAKLRRMHEQDPRKVDELLDRVGFKYSELRNATVMQLLKMAYVCGMWTDVILACRKQEEKRDERQGRRDVDFFKGRDFDVMSAFGGWSLVDNSATSSTSANSSSGLHAAALTSEASDYNNNGWVTMDPMRAASLLGVAMSARERMQAGGNGAAPGYSWSGEQMLAMTPAVVGEGPRNVNVPFSVVSGV